MPTISVVIPCLNEEKYLPKLLDDLLLQTKAPSEVIVADSNSKDKTIEVAKSYSSKLPLKLAYSKTQTAAAARNAGAIKASCDYLLFIDADMRIPKDTIERLRQIVDTTEIDFVAPRFYSDHRKAVDSFLMWIIRVDMYVSMLILNKLFCIGGFIFINKSAHESIGGFDETLITHDDTDYVEKLRKSKAKFIYLRDLKVVHDSRRFRKYGTLKSIVAIITENSQLSRHLLQPLLKKFDLHRKYGNF